MLARSLSHLQNMQSHSDSHRVPESQTSTPEPRIYSASGLASVGAADSDSFVSAAGAALASAAVGSASDEVQRVC